MNSNCFGARSYSVWDRDNHSKARNGGGPTPSHCPHAEMSPQPGMMSPEAPANGFWTPLQLPTLDVLLLLALRASPELGGTYSDCMDARQPKHAGIKLQRTRLGREGQKPCVYKPALCFSRASLNCILLRISSRRTLVGLSSHLTIHRRILFPCCCPDSLFPCCCPDNPSFKLP